MGASSLVYDIFFSVSSRSSNSSSISSGGSCNNDENNNDTINNDYSISSSLSYVSNYTRETFLINSIVT